MIEIFYTYYSILNRKKSFQNKLRLQLLVNLNFFIQVRLKVHKNRMNNGCLVAMSSTRCFTTLHVHRNGQIHKNKANSESLVAQWLARALSPYRSTILVTFIEIEQIVEAQYFLKETENAVIPKFKLFHTSQAKSSQKQNK